MIMSEHSHRQQLSVPIDPETKRRLEAAAAREDRPLASYVRRIVLKALDERDGAAA
jgi:predicted DNA-binding protein